VSNESDTPARYLTLGLANAVKLTAEKGINHKEKNMRVQKGGTDMFCPSCKKVSTCSARPAAQITRDPRDYGQRRYFAKHDDINWFQRGRECLSCHHNFITAEVDYDFLVELVELRDALGLIKSNAETYIQESTAASQSLSKLSESLSVLRALKVYKSTNG
jgi:hypothetical protein